MFRFMLTLKEDIGSDEYNTVPLSLKCKFLFIMFSVQDNIRLGSCRNIRFLDNYLYLAIIFVLVCAGFCIIRPAELINEAFIRH